MSKSTAPVFDFSDLVANVLLAATSVAPDATKIVCNQSDEAKPSTGSEIELGMAMYRILLCVIQRTQGGSGKQLQIHILVTCVLRAGTIHLEISSKSSRSSREIAWPSGFDPDMALAEHIINSNGGRLRKNADSSAPDEFIIELPSAA